MQTVKKYSTVVFALLVTIAISQLAPKIYGFFEHSSERHLIEIFFLISVIFFLSVATFYAAKNVNLPSFVLAIFFGMAAKPFLMPLVDNKEALGVLVGLGATLILFGGGLETPFNNFKKIFWKIISLSFPGLLITAFSFSFVVYYLSSLLGHPLSLTASVLLGALLASTDPAAIIPLLKKLRFKNRSLKDIVISESAVTDVTGTLLTAVFLMLIVKGFTSPSLFGWYSTIFRSESMWILFKEIVFGSLIGFLGFVILEVMHRHKKNSQEEHEADSAYFLFVPIFIFAIALALGGSGYLAAFVAGLMFHLSEHLKETESFFNFLVEGFVKPAIFIFLGALVEPSGLMIYAGVGLTVSMIFMFVIRPISVFIAAGPFAFFGKDRLGFKDLLFISFVRETGAIPAVLLTMIVSLGVKEIDGLVEIGMWVILSTLIIEPIFTTKVAQLLKVAEPMVNKKEIILSDHPIALLVSRGQSFIDRLPKVADWIIHNGQVRKVVLLLCLEDKYTKELEDEITAIALKEFDKINKESKKNHLKEIDFSFLSRQGLLQDNITKIAKEHGHRVIIFVGRKMLDFHLNEVKHLGVPFYFMD